MYVSRIAIKNWRNFTKADVNLFETTYIIGPNASGKSNLLDIFRFMRDVVKTSGGGLQQSIESRGGLTKVRSLAARKDPKIELVFELRQSKSDTAVPANWKYVLSIQSEKGGRNRPIVEKEEVYRDGENILRRPMPQDANDKELLTQTHLEQINMNSGFREIAEFFQEVLYLHLVPQLLKYSNQIILPRVESDPFGQKFLEEIAKTPNRTRDSRLRRIEDILKQVVPNFEELKFERDAVTAKPHLVMRYKHWRPKAGLQREDQFSDGTLRLIALSWTLLTSNNLVLLEEPELSLHKKVVEQIPQLLYKARQSRKQSNNQILISTHSEDVLSSKSISGNFLILRPGSAGESTEITEPSEQDLIALKAGLSPADVLMPQTSFFIGEI